MIRDNIISRNFKLNKVINYEWQAVISNKITHAVN